MIVDIHNHILYGLDDGATTLKDTIDMAKKAIQFGISHVVATPHHDLKKYYNPPTKIYEKIDEVNRLLKSENMPLTVCPGMEIGIYEDIIKDLESNKLIYLNDSHKYLLIELPNEYIPRYTEEIFEKLKFMGYVPIIAHVERNAEIRRHPTKLLHLINQGALAQVTAASVIGLLGHRLQKVTLALIKQNLVHFIASDAHNTNTRSFDLVCAYKFLDKKLSIHYSNYFKENALHIIKGTPIITAVKLQKRKKLLFNLIR
ncbi:CpsB/CapC family capsule biosynthesis tyrosine phosphatase [Bacillus sp. SM2101]|uniref:tyrosine-protein phosphatase n=1 Tax=Bacillus sp. SM2101 TaxID=2805366 RepID=UPI001BDDEB3D|nr:CpsB/CapC family capsule biosynthesis tyrosine phosphatase [Bacillus sp. SM2101]